MNSYIMQIKISANKTGSKLYIGFTRDRWNKFRNKFYLPPNRGARSLDTKWPLFAHSLALKMALFVYQYSQLVSIVTHKKYMQCLNKGLKFHKH